MATRGSNIRRGIGVALMVFSLIYLAVAVGLRDGEVTHFPWGTYQFQGSFIIGLLALAVSLLSLCINVGRSARHRRR